MAMGALESSYWSAEKPLESDEHSRREEIYAGLAANGKTLVKLHPCEQAHDLSELNFFAYEKLEEGWSSNDIEELYLYIRKEIVGTFLNGRVMGSGFAVKKS